MESPGDARTRGTRLPGRLPVRWLHGVCGDFYRKRRLVEEALSALPALWSQEDGELFPVCPDASAAAPGASQGLDAVLRPRLLHWRRTTQPTSKSTPLALVFWIPAVKLQPLGGNAPDTLFTSAELDLSWRGPALRVLPSLSLRCCPRCSAIPGCQGHPSKPATSHLLAALTPDPSLLLLKSLHSRWAVLPCPSPHLHPSVPWCSRPLLAR